MPANAAHLNGDFSDLLRLPNPAQYQIYDPLTVRAGSERVPADSSAIPFPGNIIPANRIVNPLYNLYKQMVPTPNQNLVENGTTPTGNYYRGGEPDKPVSPLFAGRVDYNSSSNDRFFFRVSGNTFLEAVSDWTYEVPGVRRPALDRSDALQLGGDRQLDARVRHDGHRHPGREQPVLPGRPAEAAARVQADRHGLAGVPRPTFCDGAERLHAARRSTSAAIRASRPGPSPATRRRTFRARST